MLRVMTCNIRTSTADDGDDHWSRRRDFCLDVIRAQDADLIGCQEVQRDQFDDLRAGLPMYAAYGMVDEAHTVSPVNAIFYRRERFDLLSSGGFWLSETPHVTGSSSWDSRCVRLANWVRLRDTREGLDFRFVNTHLDHVVQQAREEQARLITEDTAAYPTEYPQLLTGDMNCDGSNAAIECFDTAAGATRTPRSTAMRPRTPSTSSRAPPPTAAPVRSTGSSPAGALCPGHSQIVREERDGRYPSDHDFIWADVEFGV